jgi:death-on-curing protein
MEINGLDFIVDKFIVEMENIAVTVADNIIDRDLLQENITSIITEFDYNEGLKLKIVHSLSQVNPDNEQLTIGVDFYKDLF